MAAVTLYTVVIKEGAIPKLLEVLLIVFFGGMTPIVEYYQLTISACITNIVCFTIFPLSATSRLHTSISASVSSFSTLLELLSSAFLLEQTAIGDGRSTLRHAAQHHNKVIKTLKKDLEEARNEWLVESRISGHRLGLYEAVVDSLTRLAQHLSSLRTGTKMQENIILAIRQGRLDDSLIDKKYVGVQSPSNYSRGSDPGSCFAHKTHLGGTTRLLLAFRDIAGTHMDDLVVSVSDHRS